jgi:hypothetical protein
MENRDRNGVIKYFDLTPIQRFGFDVKKILALHKLTDEKVISKAHITLDQLHQIEEGTLPVEEIADNVEGLAKGLKVDKEALGRLLTSELLE